MTSQSGTLVTRTSLPLVLHYFFLFDEPTDRRHFNSAVWFKVAESGKTSDGKWAATDILTADKSVYTFTVPPKLAPGQYIVRHEM